MKLCTVYIMVNDIEKSVDFYRQLLQEEPLYSNDDRWVQFSNHIALYNYRYDKKIMEGDSSGNFSQTYIEDFNKSKENPKNDIVVFNFETEDLKKEYQRLKNLNIGEVSDLMYVNVHMPYWYFNITDPDGNVIEITGQYN
ncbi:MAG: VOC family protein [Ruminococcus flavefaciens]|nr:VOC family protein [Ruminococcus flavefaciens]MCM1229182.1 VOC family protein [Ruminococcus flavefaciens]